MQSIMVVYEGGAAAICRSWSPFTWRATEGTGGSGDGDGDEGGKGGNADTYTREGCVLVLE